MAGFSRCADIIEIVVRDLTGRKMEHLKFNGMDKLTQKKIGTKLFSKYDIDLTPDKQKDLKEEKKWINSDNTLL